MLGADDLSNELIEKVLLCADLQTIGRCRQTCRRFNETAHHSISIQYLIELAVDGLVDGPPGGWSVAERLQAVRNRRAAWRAMQPTSVQILPFSADDDEWIVHDRNHLFRQSYSRRGFVTIRRPPCLYRGIPEKEWSIKGAFVELRWYPEEDLVVETVAETETDGLPHGRTTLRLRSFETQEDHPGAFNSILNYGFLSGHEDVIDITAFNVADDYLSFSCLRLANQDPLPGVSCRILVIYNWKTGVVVLRLISEPAWDEMDYVLLTNQYLLLFHFDDGLAVISVINLGVLHETASKTGCPLTLSLSNLGVDSEVTVCRLQFPNLHRGGYISTQLPKRPWRPRAEELQVPFYMNEDRLLTVIWENLYDRSLGVNILIPLATIHTCIQEADNQKGKHLFTWEEWGIQGARVIDRRQMRLNALGQCAMSAIYLEEADRDLGNWEGPGTRMFLYHFGRYAVRKHLADLATGTASPGVGYSPKAIFEGGSYGQIVTELPAIRVAIPASVLKHSTQPDEYQLAVIVPGDDWLVLQYVRRNSVGFARFETRLLTF
ncbi:hypothetical protein BXZ70DRAFT_118383 [Cristinia sonorae]|uniref:F-box domain-containing protein n=1 Tax=Cristinia sonorae TaxID=1940300 RepID=A0A8K0XQM4_9AGAR|nr:hypothetical protein BXZ70DRAFT_118383 [Cristinia sonorae]